jgi:hypothetical protein
MSVDKPSGMGPIVEQMKWNNPWNLPTRQHSDRQVARHRRSDCEDSLWRAARSSFGCRTGGWAACRIRARRCLRIFDDAGAGLQLAIRHPEKGRSAARFRLGDSRRA